MDRVLALTFATSDPAAVAVGLTTDEFDAFCRIVSGSAGTDGTSLVAREATTGELVGALLTDDPMGPAPEGLGAWSPKLDPIIDLFEGVVAPAPAPVPAGAGEVLHLFLLGVAPPLDRSWDRVGAGPRLPGERSVAGLSTRDDGGDQPRLAARVPEARLPSARDGILRRLPA